MIARRIATLSRPERLLVLLIVLHCAQATWVVVADLTPPHFAVLDNTARAMRCADEMRHHGPGILADPGAMVGIALGESGYRPPLLMLQALPTLALFGGFDAATLTIVPWVALLLWGTYRLGSRGSDGWCGLLAAVLVGGFPIVLGHRTQYLPFLPLAAAVVWCADAMAMYRVERGRRPLVLLGVWAGLGMLIRFDFPAYLIALVVGHLVACEGRRGQAFVDLLRAGCLSAVICGGWYVASFGTTIEFYLGEGLLDTSHKHDGVELFTWANLAYYPWALLRVMAGPLGLLGVVALFVRRDAESSTLRWWVLIGWLFFLVVPMKSPRYMLPALPALAIAAARWLRPHRRAAIAAVAVALLPAVLLVHTPVERVWTDSATDPTTWSATPENRERALDFGRLRPWQDPRWFDMLDQLARAVFPELERRMSGKEIDGPAIRAVVVDDKCDVYFKPLALMLPSFEIAIGHKVALTKEPLESFHAIAVGYPASSEMEVAVDELRRRAIESGLGPRLIEVPLPDGKRRLALYLPR